MKALSFWTNKGGTGKTSLVADLCPQANLTELFLGGLIGHGHSRLSEFQNGAWRKTIGSYFQKRRVSKKKTKFIPEEALKRRSGTAVAAFFATAIVCRNPLDDKKGSQLLVLEERHAGAFFIVVPMCGSPKGKMLNRAETCLPGSSIS